MTMTDFGQKSSDTGSTLGYQYPLTDEEWWKTPMYKKMKQVGVEGSRLAQEEWNKRSYRG